MSGIDLARTVADAVLFEGYLLYPYRATSRKNQVRWQFGVLGSPGAAEAGVGEESEMSAQCLLRSGPDGRVRPYLRFLQLQTRSVERATEDPARFESVDELNIGARSWLSWDEAVEHEIELDGTLLSALGEQGRQLPVDVDGGDDVEFLLDDDGAIGGRLLRRRWPLHAMVSVCTEPVDGLDRLSISVANVATDSAGDKDAAIRSSLIGAHLLLSAQDAAFVSLLEPPDEALQVAKACRQHRCWPVMAGASGDTDVVLVSPIILYDYPEVADQSAGALFDSTEIDEILTLRVMTLTDEEKAEARATDPRAAEIIDRCDAMSPEALAQLHGILRDPRAGMAVTVPDTTEEFVDLRDLDPPTFETGDMPWWDPETDASVNPDVDTVVINGVGISRNSLVRIHPSRRADAQDIFFAGQTARVSAVHSDVDGNVHVAVVLVDDPAAEMHEWYGRYLYFAPDELEPLTDREESRS
ncbi:hypothetical protein BH18ACT8_BH18ACT8_07520 [soil metagenome]